MTEEQSRIERLESEIADLKMRWPPHSVPVTMWQQLEALEEAMELARAEEEDGQEDSPG
jgi:hypothetical protein